MRFLHPDSKRTGPENLRPTSNGIRDTLEVDGKPVFPSQNDTEVHWFRSGLVWSPDGRHIAVVDQRQREGAFYLVLVGVAGSKFEHKLEWQEKAEDWPPDLDFRVRWAGNQIVITHGERTQAVVMAR